MAATQSESSDGLLRPVRSHSVVGSSGQVLRSEAGRVATGSALQLLGTRYQEPFPTTTATSNIPRMYLSADLSGCGRKFAGID